MRLVKRILPAAMLAVFAVSVVGAAQAETPTPAASPAATATTAPPEPAVFAVIPWVNGENAARGVIAKIGETICATGVPNPGAGTRGIFHVSVPSEEVVPGCGREGAIVTFFVDGQQAPQTAIWHPRAFPGASQTVQVIIGPPFALISGGVGPGRVSPRQAISPYVGNVPCGHGEAGGPGDAYEAVVYSAEQQAGCGTEGAQVTFKLLDAQGNVIAVANEKAVWHVWDGVSHPQRLDLTFGPATVITMPGTGTGDGPQHAGSAWALLGFVGLASAATGFALRKQALTR